MKLPELSFREEVTDESVRDRDMAHKLQEKSYADMARSAKQPTVIPGD